MYAWQFAQMNAIARENGWTTFINMHCGGNMRIIALIDDVDVLERILKHLKVWDPQPDTVTPAGPDPPLPQGETLSLTYHPVPAHLTRRPRMSFGPVIAESPRTD